MIWHVTDPASWHKALDDGLYATSTRGASLAEVGYIHASYAHQLPDVVATIYGDIEGDMVLLEIDEDFLSPILDIKVEPAAPDYPELFPHIYGPIPLGAITAYPAHISHGVLTCEGVEL